MFLTFLHLVRADIPPEKFGSNVQLWCDLPSSKYIASTSVRSRILGTSPQSGSQSHSARDNQAAVQNAEYREKDSQLYWIIRKLKAGQEMVLTANISLKQQDTQGNLRKQVGPISLDFDIPMHNISHLKVKYLKINQIHSQGQAFRWVRYMTRANSYIVRV